MISRSAAILTLWLSLMMGISIAETGGTSPDSLGDGNVLIETYDFAANTSTVEHRRNGVVVSSSTTDLNHLGQADLTTITGAGLPATTLDPVFRADGSLASVSMHSGGDTWSADFGATGILTGMDVPLLGDLQPAHSFSGGAHSRQVKAQLTE